MASKVIACSACGVLVRTDDGACPNCGVTRRSVFAPGAILLGLALTGCPADDGTETMGGTGSASATNASSNSNTTMSSGASMSSTSAGTDSATTDDTLETSAQPPYGVPDTTSSGPDTGTASDTDTDTDTTDGTSSSDSGGVKLDLPPDGG